jgi:molybdopterin-containing oxidoreductase family iron-sulfur binding subunit
MRLMGASLALAGGAACRRPVEHIVPYVEAPAGLVPGIPQRYATAMPLGTTAFGLVVESHEGRPGKVEGNELHPGSGGAATAWMQAATLGLYDPDRSREVFQGRGEAAAPSTWEAFEQFWREQAEKLEADGGNRLAVLSEPFASPTRARLLRNLRERFPQARIVFYEPWSEEHVFTGVALATGEAGRPLYHLERARCVAVFDADLLLTEGEAVTHARGLAAARRPGPEMARLYAVEGPLSLTGANADHRLRLPSRQVPAAVTALARALGVDPGPWAVDGGLPAAATARIRALADDLAAAGDRALVAVGRIQPAPVHALAYRIHEHLGALGRTVTVAPLADVGWGRTADLADLVRAVEEGAVETLVLLGGNPVYDAPGDLGFDAALAAVPVTVHLALALDETSRSVDWHLPQAHFLESWGDARAADGTAGVVQPLIAPLFGGRSAIELLALLGGREGATGHQLVRETWGVAGEGADEDATWRRTLHDGIAAPGAGPVTSAPVPGVPDAAELVRQAGAMPPETGGLELVLRPSATVYDGRFANLAWLQELPDPLTKLTWDNAAVMSPATARELGLESGDLAVLSARGQTVEVPVFVLPGQADGTVSLALGYGRTAAGRVGTGVGVDAHRLRSAARPWIDGGVTVERTGRRYPLATTQEHGALEDRDLVRRSTRTELLGGDARGDHSGDHHSDDHRSDDHHGAAAAHGAAPVIFASPPLTGKHQWGMAIDLSACTGCGACVVACQSENNIPVVGKEQVARNREMHWLRVDRYFAGPADEPAVLFQPMPCQHCENAPCEQVCPVAATVHDAEGLNLMVYNRCIGTRYCSNNCPYKVRRFNFFNYTKDAPELLRLAMNPEVTVRSRGVMEKCTFCVQRIQQAKIEARRAGRQLQDGDVVTACQQTCAAGAIHFGDLADPASRVTRAQGDRRSYVLLEELGNRPRTSYLARVENPNPAWEVV